MAHVNLKGLMLGRFDQIRIELLSRHLLEPQGGASGSALVIHRSLQKNLLFRFDRDRSKKQQVFERATKLVRKNFPVQSPIGVPVNHRWAIYESYLPHVLTLHAVYLSSKPELYGTVQFADLLCDAGYYMWDRHLGREGIPVLETAERICLQDENKHLRRLRANIGVALGSLLNTVGISELQRAVMLFDEILTLRQEHIAELPLPLSREDQLLLSNAWNDKGWMCLEREDYFAAEVPFEKSLEIKRQWPEQDIPFEFAETLKNLAFVRLAQKRSRSAIELASHALDLVEGDQDSGSATVQKFRLRKAEMLANSGQIKEAIKIVDKVAAERAHLYRPYHPSNLDVYYIRGILFHYDDRLTEAESMLRQTLNTDIHDPYPQECRARCLFALSEVIKKNGKTKESEHHRNEALELLNQWRSLFQIEYTDNTDISILFDHVVPFKCSRLSRYGKLWVGTVG